MYIAPWMLNTPNPEADGRKELQVPKRRLQVRDDFPRLVVWKGRRSSTAFDSLYSDPLGKIRSEISKRADWAKDATRVTIAYPHKVSGFFTGKPHRVTEAAYAFADDMKRLMPEINWIVADGLCENKNLRRRKSGNQGIESTFKRKQGFSYFPTDQTDPLPFMEKGADRELFVVFDDCYYQGTTAVSLVNLIENNGGHVLAGFSEYDFAVDDYAYLQQKTFGYSAGKDQSLVPAFSKAAYNKGRIPELAAAFYKHAQATSKNPPQTPESCLDQVENGLNSWGHSLTTLTNGECSDLQARLKGYVTMTKAVKGIPYDRFIGMISNGPL